MCRLVIYRSRTAANAVCLSDLFTRPEHSIIKQSFNARERMVAGEIPPALNADGFGIGWYSMSPDAEGVVIDGPPDASSSSATEVMSSFETASRPAVFKQVTPAWNNANLQNLAHVVRSSCIFGHVRAASPGSLIAETNTHPFSYGQYLWMHNGAVGGWGSRVRRRIITYASDDALGAVHGTSDSEHCFAIFLTEVQRIQPLHSPATADVVQGCLIRTIHTLERILHEEGVTEASLLNFAVSDGRTVAACVIWQLPLSSERRGRN